MISIRAGDFGCGRGVITRPRTIRNRPLHVVAVHFLLRGRQRALRPAEYIPPVEVFDAMEPDYFGMGLAHVVQLHAREKMQGVATSLLKSLLVEVVSQGSPKPESALRRITSKPSVQ